MILTKKMNFINETWFWLVIFAILTFIVFLLVYLDEKFSTLAILLIIVGFVMLLLAGITGLLNKGKTDINRVSKTLGDEIVGRVDVQRGLINVTLDAINKAGNSSIKLTKTTAKAFPEGIKPMVGQGVKLVKAFAT